MRLEVRAHPGGQRRGHVQDGDALVGALLHGQLGAHHGAGGRVGELEVDVAQLLAHVALDLVHAVAHLGRALGDEVGVGLPVALARKTTRCPC
jgi:hypothetical protein